MTFFKKLNLNPEKEIVSDCSTRSLVFLLQNTKDEEDYDSMKARQIEVSVATSGKRNDWWAFYVLESILFSRGWMKISFFKKIIRKRLTWLFKDIPAKILTESSGHVAPIYKGKIFDTWDCSKGRVLGIMFKGSYFKRISRILDANGILWTRSF